ncbi:hypothetical protein [Bacillus subtilis]|uniref:hypothetical protein n=1 Tax=Bacillus subtilis TaxID=1423 RepID=UPI000849FA3D|nr:hypothetical protein [Bacillus subtilis]ODV47895.1 hypothetical protein BCM26_05670 [Bacillus subtilis]OJH63493.1 hypothetical protein BOH71_09610 [Bacillus subtilis]
MIFIMLVGALLASGVTVALGYGMRHLIFIPVLFAILSGCSCIAGAIIYENADKEMQNKGEIVSIKSIPSKDDRNDYYVCITKELKEIKIKKDNVKLKVTDSKPHIEEKTIKSDLTTYVASNLFPFADEDITIYISKPMKEKLISS